MEFSGRCWKDERAVNIPAVSGKFAKTNCRLVVFVACDKDVQSRWLLIQ
jgi:hypothetical protein